MYASRAAVLVCQGGSGDNSLQSLSDDLISNELSNIHGHQGSSAPQASESAKDTANGAREQTASAVEYVEKQLKTPADKVGGDTGKGNKSFLFSCFAHQL